MNDAERNDFANAADEALQNEHVTDVIKEQLRNLRVKEGGLEEYGLRKIARYAAIVARCQALGIDPDEMRATPNEVTEHQVKLAQAFTDAGKPVIWVKGQQDA